MKPKTTKNFSRKISVISVLALLVIGLFPFLTSTPLVYASSDMLPSDGDAWTENGNSTVTWYCSSYHPNTLKFTMDDKKVGSYSLLANHTGSTDYIAIYLDLNELKDVSSLDTLVFWLKFVSWTSEKMAFDIGETGAWTGTRFAYPLYTVPNNTWTLYTLPFKAWYNKSGSPSWSQIRYIGFQTSSIGSADNTLLYIDGLRFQSFDLPTTTNAENDLLLPNLFAFYPRFAEKRQVYNDVDYTGLYSCYYVQGGTGEYYSALQSEVLGQSIVASVIGYNTTKDVYLLDKAKTYAEWLIQFQHATYKAFYMDFNNATKAFAGSGSITFQGWILAGFSYLYGATLNTTYKTVADSLRWWFCDVMWNSTNKWYDGKQDLDTGVISRSTSWVAMPQGASIAGLASYYRFVSNNVTVKFQLDSNINKVLTTVTTATPLLYGKGFEPDSYVSWGLYEAWKAFNNQTYRTLSRNDVARRLNNYLLKNDGSQIYSHSAGRLTSAEYFDGWGLAFSQLLQMLLYEDGETRSLSTYQKTMFDYVDSVIFSDYWAISRYYESNNIWENVTYTPSQLFLWTSLVKYYCDIYKPSYPYLISATGEITLSSYSNNKLTLTISASSGQTSTTKIYCADKGNPYHVDGASSWSYDGSTKIVTINVVHSSSNHTLHIVFEYSPVGGIWITVDKFGLLAPYIGVASTILVATAIYVKRVKRRKEKR